MTTPTPGPTTPVRKVAVLGGGIGGLAAAFELTATPELRARHEVTVYTDGWLLGGKCSSVRNAAEGMRSEEHGLHMLMGFYENSFDMLRRCYKELDRPSSDPLSTFEKAFSPRDTAAFYERVDGAWDAWVINFPRNHRVPGQSKGFASEAQIMSELVKLLAEGVAHSVGDVGAGLLRPFSSRMSRFAKTLGGLTARGFVHRATTIADKLANSANPQAPEHTHGILWFVEHSLQLIEHLAHDADDAARRTGILLDLGMTVVKGMLADNVIGKGFSSIDGEDLIAWLKRHGSQHAESAPILAFYGATFAYPDGNSRQPMLAAGVGLSGLLRLFLDYRGAIMYAPNAGLGETVMTPMYELLKKRGVRFRFFQKVCAIKPSTDGTRIERVRIGQQVRLKALEYEPLVACGALNVWPAEPDYAQISAPTDLRKYKPRAHQKWNYPTFISENVLQRGVDFHDVVLAIPPQALGELAHDLVKQAPETWGRMIQNTKSVHTVGLECWFDRTSREMGWKDNPPVAGAYAAPIDTWADTSQQLALERPGVDDGGGNAARAYIQICGVRPAAIIETDQEQEIIRIREICKAWMAANSANIWPKAASQTNPAGLDWDRLIDPRGRTGSARFDWQYISASLEAADAYVQSAPGTTAFRLPPNGSGFENLYLAGDWVRTGLNAGAFEAAVMGGLGAARAISGDPTPVGE